MSYFAAITRLKVLAFTDLANSYDSVNMPPLGPDLPALVIEDASQPFVDSLAVWNVGLDKSNFVCFVDHILCIETLSSGSYLERRANIITFLDRYLVAINNDMTLNDNLSVPLQLIVVERGVVEVRKSQYSGIRFRHKWELKIT